MFDNRQNLARTKVKMCVSCERPLPLSFSVCPYCLEKNPCSVLRRIFICLYPLSTLITALVLSLFNIEFFVAAIRHTAIRTLTAPEYGFISAIIVILHYLPVNSCAVGAPLHSHRKTLFRSISFRTLLLLCSIIILSLLSYCFHF